MTKDEILNNYCYYDHNSKRFRPKHNVVITYISSPVYAIDAVFDEVEFNSSPVYVKTLTHEKRLEFFTSVC